MVCSAFAIATNAQEPATGIPKFSSVQSVGIDSINKQNLNVNFSIPIASSAARGGNFSFPIVNDSLLWMKSSGRWTPVVDSAGSPTWGWKTKLPAGMTRFTNITERCDSPPPYQSSPHYFNYSYVDPAGTTHKFSVNYYAFATICGFPTGSRAGYATDGSGYYLNATTGYAPIVTAPDGKVITGTNWTDSNGNYFSATLVNSSETDWKDSAGHTPLKIITSNTSIQYQYPDTSNAYQTATLKLTSTPIKTNFACAGVIDYSGTANLPTELDLANGQKYFFTYEPTPGMSGYYTGRIKRVTLPTGGYIEHLYGTTNDGINCSDATVMNLTVVVSDGSAPSTWTFTRAQNGSNWVTTVTAPQLSYDTTANQSTSTFNSSGQQIAEKFYQGSVGGSLLRTTNTTWTAGGFPSTQITILEDNSTQSEIETSYDFYGNLLTLKEHDWGTGTPGNILRTTTYTYLNGSAYLAANIVNRPTRITIADGTGAVKVRTDIAYDEASYINSPCITGAVQHNDATYTCSYSTRGNATTVISYIDPVTPGGAISKHGYYDSLGNLVKADVNCCQQQTWSYSPTTSYSFPDSVTSGVTGTQLAVNSTYDPYTGLLASTQDANNQTTSYAYADPGHLNRLTSVTRPDNKQLFYSYDDVNLTFQATSPIQGSNVLVQKSFVDALGRTIKNQVLDAGGASYSVVEMQYDSWGRAYRTSNPHNATAQYWTEARTDALGRAVKTILPDGGQTVQGYSANSVTITDPSGIQRKSVADGLGRMTAVYEPDVTAENALTQQTTYQYDVLDDLKQVSQGVQIRTFVYDALGRLTDSTTPEAGHFNFQYNNYNLLSQRTDARGVITTYTYDGLNRPYQVIYNVGSTGVPATPTVTFSYGSNPGLFNKGRMVSMTDGSGSESYSYDQFGGITQIQKVIGATTYTLGYQYNFGRALSQITYPSGRVVLLNYDSIGRLCSVGAAGSSCTTGTTYGTGYVYNSAWQITGLTYGNGVTLSATYYPDSLLMQTLQYKKGAQTLFGLNYWYKTDAANCPSGASFSSGQIQCITDTVDNGRSAVYGYDALYRLISARTTGSANYPLWGLAFTYDRYGNRSAETVTAGSGVPANCLGVSAATNRVTGPCGGGSFSYDSNGNMTNDGANTLVYDAENRIVTAGTSTYTYDGSGLRVKKVSGGTTTVTIFSSNMDIAEYLNGAAPSAPTNEYIYSSGQKIVGFQSGSTYYFHNDHLSPRFRTDTAGTSRDARGTYPFGELWYSTPNPAWLFTSYYRDAETGNDYAMARSYVNRYGRFSTPDPLSGSIGDPQSLNRYAYVNNDPCNRLDPLGLSSTCTLNVALATTTGVSLSDSQKDSITNRINTLLSSTKVPGGNSVQIATNFHGAIDYTLEFTTKGTFESLIGKSSSSILGYALVGIATAELFPNDMASALRRAGKRAMDFTTLAGSVGAHELVHLSTGVPDLAYKDDAPNSMMIDNAPADEVQNALSHPNSPLWKFSGGQLASMYRDCILRHSPAPKPPKGTGGSLPEPPNLAAPNYGAVNGAWVYVHPCVSSDAGQACEAGYWEFQMPF
jgi:RHS repeat-associated protein